MPRWPFHLTVLLLFPLLIRAQKTKFPQNYFRNPLDIPMDLEANLGELRPNHWHMGLDIRTSQRENLPVHAAADGYIAAIGIRPESFGRFIIINHPNGLSTLYAHLNDFFPALEQYVTAQQYKQENWAIELKFTPQQFPVSKGQFIAYSGNTGGSQGPHLHFEIFNTATEKRMNLLFFGLPLNDDTPPTILKLGLYDRSKTVYVQSSQLFPVTKTSTGYTLKNPVIKTSLSNISFAIEAYDKMRAGGSEDGIYSAKLYVDDKLQFDMALDSLSYDETLYINAATDHMLRSNGGIWLQHLSQLPGNHCGIYKPTASGGLVRLADSLPHMVRIEVSDAFSHLSTLSFSIQHTHDVVLGGALKNYTSLFVPNQANELKKTGFEVSLSPDALYDSVPVVYASYPNNASYAVSPSFQLSDASIPVHTHFTIRIKPDRNIPDSLKNKVLVERNSHGSTVKKAEWQGGWLTARMGDFGTYTAFTDNIPPQINDLKGSQKINDTVLIMDGQRIIFQPTDNFDVIKTFRAELDGKWLRFTNDKGRYFVYTFDERCPYGIHRLKVTVEDLVGNQASREWWFKRTVYTPPPAKKKKSIVKSKHKKKK